jgi:chromate reductase, NAD(P)H dehydrogenase (quinone)
VADLAEGSRLTGGPIRILGIPGSVRSDSLNLALLEAAARAIAPAGELSVFGPSELATIPPFQPGVEPPPETGVLRGGVEDADAVLVATPEYNGSIPGGLKNAIDWLSAPARRGPIRGKPAAVVGADRGEIGCDWAHADARKVLELAGARVIADGLSVDAAAGAFGADGGLRDAEQHRALKRVVDELVAESLAPG